MSELQALSLSLSLSLSRQLRGRRRGGGRFGGEEAEGTCRQRAVAVFCLCGRTSHSSMRRSGYLHNCIGAQDVRSVGTPKLINKTQSTTALPGPVVTVIGVRALRYHYAHGCRRALGQGCQTDPCGALHARRVEPAGYFLATSSLQVHSSSPCPHKMGLQRR